MAAPLPDSLNPRREAGRLLAVLVALLLLAGGSWALAHASLGPWSAPAALLIAALKASLVALFFMRLFHETVAARFAIGIAVGFISLLAALVATDVLLR
jgi:cytochrome c oxidase subunit 4